MQARSETVNNVSGVRSDGPDIIPEMVSADLITTAVGPNVLKIIAPTLARGIEARAEQGAGPLNIIACENMVRASSSLQAEVYRHLSDAGKAYADQQVGFPNSAVDRIVPPFSGQGLDVGVEDFYEWIVERPAFKGEVPNIPGMQLTDNLVAYVQRKLFTLNTGHAIAAYLGALKGYATVGQSVADPQIREAVTAAMRQSGAALVKQYGFDPAQHEAYIQKVLGRFDNPHIHDEVLRVGREPLRKLSAHDRPLGPAKMNAELGLANDALLQGVAAALLYRNEADPQAKELAQRIDQEGIEHVISALTGYPANSPEYAQILQDYRKLLHSAS